MTTKLNPNYRAWPTTKDHTKNPKLISRTLTPSPLRTTEQPPATATPQELLASKRKLPPTEPSPHPSALIQTIKENFDL
jgi:hypothetical protein